MALSAVQKGLTFTFQITPQGFQEGIRMGRAYKAPGKGKEKIYDL
jgi:hypothetical protein